MQGKTSESCDFLELQVTNKFEKSTKQNLSPEKSFQNTNKKKNVLFVIERKKKLMKGGMQFTHFVKELRSSS